MRSAESAASRAAARVALDEIAGADASRLGIRSRAGAPPRVVEYRGRFRCERYTLSLAHRDGIGVAAAGRDGMRVGVDVERDSELEPGHARYFATSQERASVRHSLAEIWALKEAAWKALACTPDLPFTALELRFAADGSLCAVERLGTRHDAGAVFARLGSGHIVACCWISRVTQ